MTDYGYKTKDECNGMQVTIDLSKPEAHKEIDVKEFMDLVGNQGYSFSGGIFDDGRKQENWTEQEVFALDFDNKEDENSITPEQVLGRCAKFDIQPFGIYRSLSSKTQTDKFRVLFRHYTVIKHAKVANYILKMFQLLFPEVDTACSEISRLFYGGKETTYTKDDAEFNIVCLNNAIAQVGTENNKLEDYKQFIQVNCENAALTTEVKLIMEDFKDDKNVTDRVFEYDDVEYMVQFSKIVIPEYKPEQTKTTNKSKTADGKEFLSYQDIKKIKSALPYIKDEYNNWLEVIWGLNNTYGEPAWELALEWSKKSPKYKSDTDVRKKWDDSSQRGEISVGSLYHIAKEAGWQYKDEVIEAFNKEFFVSKLGTKTLVFEPKEDPVTKRQTLVWQDKRNFREMYQSKKTKVSVRGSNKEICAVDYWYDHVDMRMYRGGVYFDPSNKLPKNCYNMWQGYKYDDPNYVLPEEKDSKLIKYLDHIYRNIASRDMVVFDYVFNWMAKAIQQPWIKAPVALVLRSDDEGVGKGVFANWFGELFGECFQIISDPSQIVGAFNGHLQNCILLHSDEAEFGKKHHSILKNITTEKFININPKGMSAFQAKSYLHIIMSSNSDFVVPASIGSRRFCILDVLSENRKDDKFFESMRKDMEAGGYKELFYRLKNRDISKFNINNYPETDALNKQRMFALEKEDKFIYEKLEFGIMDDERGTWDYVTSDILFRDYNDWVFAKYGHGKFKKSPTELGMFLNKLFGSDAYWQKKRTDKMVKVGNDYVSKKVSKYELPTLNTCRRLFEDHVGFKLKWQDIEDDNQPEIIPDTSENKIIQLNFKGQGTF